MTAFHDGMCGSAVIMVLLGRRIQDACCSLPLSVVGKDSIQHRLCALKQLGHGLEQRNAHNAQKPQLRIDTKTLCVTSSGTQLHCNI